MACMAVRRMWGGSLSKKCMFKAPAISHVCDKTKTSHCVHESSLSTISLPPLALSSSAYYASFSHSALHLFKNYCSDMTKSDLKTSLNVGLLAGSTYSICLIIFIADRGSYPLSIFACGNWNSPLQIACCRSSWLDASNGYLRNNIK